MGLQTSGMTRGSEIITITDQRYVVRYQTPELALLGVDRAREAAVLNYLAAVDNKAMISPTMIEQHSQQLVVSYIWGKTAKKWTKPLLKKVAMALKQLQQQTVFAALDEVNISERCSALAKYAPHLIAPPIEPQLTELKSLCHFDLHLGNIVKTGQKLAFIDWEYAGYAHPFWELALFLQANHLAKRQENYFLKHYFSDHPLLSFRQWQAQKKSCLQWADYLIALWLICHQQLN